MEYLKEYKRREYKEVKRKKRAKVPRSRRKVPTHKVLSKIMDCPKCRQKMERRTHKEITDKVLAQAYYYSEWDYCTSCNHVQHYEQYKTYNKNDKGIYSKGCEEESERLNFILTF